MSSVVVIPKKRTGGPRPPLFWYDTDFLEFFFWKKFFFEKSVSYQKKAGAAPRARPSFGMTMIQDIRDLFV